MKIIDKNVIIFEKYKQCIGHVLISILYSILFYSILFYFLFYLIAKPCYKLVFPTVSLKAKKKNMTALNLGQNIRLLLHGR